MTLLLTGLFISPLLDVRNRRFQVKTQARDDYARHVLGLIAATMALTIRIQADASEAVREALEGERTRWREQIEQSTRHLIDRGLPVGVQYGSARVAALLGEVAFTARMVWISERAEERKLDRLRRMCIEFRTLFFGHWLQPLSRYRTWVRILWSDRRGQAVRL